MIPKTKNRTAVMCRASFTVEAAFIIPLFSCLLVIVLFFAFYLHDITIMRAKIHQSVRKVEHNLQQGIIRGKLANASSHLFLLDIMQRQEKENRAEQIVWEGIEQGLIYGTIADRRINLSENQLMVMVELSFYHQKNSLLHYFHLYPKSVIIEVKRQLFYGEEFTRVIDVGLRTGRQVKGMNDSK